MGQMTLAELDPERSALVVMHYTNHAVHPDGFFMRNSPPWPAMVAEAIPQVQTALAAVRRAGLLVVFGQGAWSEGYPDLNTKSGGLGEIPQVRRNLLGSWDAEFYEAVAPQKEEITIRMTGLSAFSGTPLGRILVMNGVMNLFIIGISSRGCPESTARDALDHGYRTIVLPDCCPGEPSMGKYEYEAFVEWANHVATAVVTADEFSGWLVPESPHGRARP
ncbi:isochorismatase family cysteine hydrolase [Sciscionella marina]|uniref:isochorismatase family cysteine hydrolase n=1 Tax=Sciscionella marina TaxID=508770 RepID=UPI000367831F|nr:cysteine hydrolase family protein [Sciscionella marina]